MIRPLLSVAAWIGLALITTIPSVSQDYALFHGTWYHATFIETLQKTASVERAMARIAPGEPLYMRFDSTNNDGRVITAWDLRRTEDLVMLKTQIPKVGMTWAIGTSQGPLWVAGVDERARTYVALTPVDSVERAMPTVLGKLPSKNEDPAFLLKRMVNVSYLVGAWSDAKGKRYAFTVGMEATIGTTVFPYELSVDPVTYAVTLTSTKGKPVSYLVARMGTSLTLTPIGTKHGAVQPIVLNPERRTSK